jgi:hypothetical protein
VDAFAGPYAVAAVLLVVAGFLEVRRPAATVDALGRLGITVPAPIVRVVAFAGALVGAAALGAGGGPVGQVAAALVALAYVAFTVLVAAMLVRDDPLASCGCFGRDDTPPGVTHIVLDVAAAAVAVAVVAAPGTGFRGAVAHQPFAGLPFLAVTALCAVLAYLVLTRPSSTRRSGAGGDSSRELSG